MCINTYVYSEVGESKGAVICQVQLGEDDLLSTQEK